MLSFTLFRMTNEKFMLEIRNINKKQKNINEVTNYEENF